MEQKTDSQGVHSVTKQNYLDLLHKTFAQENGQAMGYATSRITSVSFQSTQKFIIF